MRKWLGFLAFAMVCACSPPQSPTPATRIEADRSVSLLQVERLKAGGLGVADSSVQARPLLPIAMKLIQEFEGWSAEPYDDPVGYCTIGFGRLLALKACAEIDTEMYENGISLQVGERYLDEDTRYARAVVARLVRVEITDDQFGALASFVYNVGERNFENSTLLRLLNSDQPDLAAKQLRRWVKSRGEVLPGLVTRRDCEGTLYKGLARTRNDGAFDRASCQALGAATDVGELVDIEIGE